MCKAITAHLSTSPESTTVTIADDSAVVATDSDPAIASQKLQTNLLATQNWFKERRMKANESKSVHVTFTTRRETCPPVHINNVQLLTYLPGTNTFSQNGNNCESPSPKCTGYLDASQNSLSNKILIYKTLLKPIWTYGIQHFQHRNSRTFPIESLAHDSGRTLTNTVIRRALQIPTVIEEIRRYSSQYSARLSAHPNGLTVNLIELPDKRRLRSHLPNDLPTRFLV
jgi:hypothetical protein